MPGSALMPGSPLKHPLELPFPPLSRGEKGS